MEPTVRIRSRTARALGVATLVVAAGGLVSTVADGAVLDFGAPLVLIGLLGWAAFWRPYVEVSDGGVLVVNTLRTVHVPWPAIEAVEGRYGLRLRTAYGAVTAWAAGAPTGRQRARGVESEAATAVTERLETLRGGGAPRRAAAGAAGPAHDVAPRAHRSHRCAARGEHGAAPARLTPDG